MKVNRARAYAISITILAVILLAVVIALAVKLNNREAQSPEPETTQAAETVPETTTRYEEPESSTTAAAEETQTTVNVYNVGGSVGWDAGNNDQRNLITAWGEMLRQLDVDADIAFFGDSILQRCDYRPYFKDSKVVNLGCGGDTIRGVYNRAEMLSYVNAERIVVMCGVNVLRSDNVDECRTEYAGLLNAIMEYSPRSQVYVCSILPMGKEWQEEYCDPETTKEFNAVIKELAEKRSMTYVDLYPLFEADGELDPEYTVDGVHLSKEGYDLLMNALYYYMYYR